MVESHSQHLFLKHPEIQDNIIAKKKMLAQPDIVKIKVFVGSRVCFQILCSNS